MDITIYSTTQCAACRALTSWLDKKGYAYSKKITDQNDAYMSEFMDLNDGMIGVPFTVIRKNKRVVAKFTGFEPKKIEIAILGS